jgi:hypothetical protein
MRSEGDQVCVGGFGFERLVRSIRETFPRSQVLVGLVIASCGWAGLAGAAQAAVPGTISTIAGNGSVGNGGNGAPATGAELDYPADVVADSGGDLLIADPGNSLVRLVAGSNCASACPFGLGAMTKGDIYVVAGNGARGYGGDGGTARSAQLNFPFALVLDRQGNLLIADQSDNVVRLVARVSCTSDCPYGLKSMVAGSIYPVAGNSTGGFAGDGGLATNAELNGPSGMAFDQAGDLLVSDSENNRIRLVANSSCSSACPFGLPSMSEGSIYTLAGDGLSGIAGDDGPASVAELADPDSVAFDGVGDLLISDWDRSTIRLVAATSCAFDCQYGLRSMTPGDIYTVAGNGTPGYNGDGRPAGLAEMYGPSLTVDGVGDLLIADMYNNRVRIVPDVSCTTACLYGPSALHKGFMYTLAGTGVNGFSGDGALAASAEMSWSRGISVDGDSNLLIADANNNRIRMVTAAQPPPVCYEVGAREVGQDGFTGTRDQEDVIVYAPAGLASISDVTVVNGTATHAAFTPGTKGPVVVTATKTVQSLGVSGYYKATDTEGRYSFCGFYLAAG